MDEQKRKRAEAIKGLIEAGWSPPTPADVQTKRMLDSIKRMPANATLSLSPREVQVINIVAHGYTLNETAKLLGIGRETVKTESASARRKLGARNIAHAVALALEAGLIDSFRIPYHHLRRDHSRDRLLE